MGVPQSLDRMGHRGRTAARDAWVFGLLSARPELKTKFSDNKVAKAALRKSACLRREWCKHRVAPAQCATLAFPSAETLLAWWQQNHSSGPVASCDDASAASSTPAAGEDKGASRVHGFMLTWTGRWGCRKPEVQQLMQLDSASTPASVLAEMVKANEFLHRIVRPAPK